MAQKTVAEHELGIMAAPDGVSIRKTRRGNFARRVTDQPSRQQSYDVHVVIAASSADYMCRLRKSA
jgi:hypothetical protein